MSRAARIRALTAALSEALLLVLAFFVAYEIRSQIQSLPALYGWDRYLILPLVAVPTWLAVGASAGLYRGARRSFLRDVGSLAWAAVLSALVLAALAFFLKQQEQSRPLIVIYMAVAFSQLVVLRAVVRALGLDRLDRRSNVIVVGSGDQVVQLCRRLRTAEETSLVGVIAEEGDGGVPPGIRVLGRIEDCETIFRREVVDEVIFVVPRTRLLEVENAFSVAEDMGLATKLILSFLPHRMSRVDLEDLQGAPVLSFSTAPGHPVKLAVKRSFDIVVSAVALILCAPLFAALAIAIKLDSPGPVFFSQVRSGRNGRTFRLFKFRSMVTDAEKRLAELRAQNEMSGPVFKMTHDPRVTRLGRFIRKSSLDELPQFWNVLVGDMSVVGPRPPIPAEVQQYERWQRRRLSVRPGITCTWQISGRNEIDFATWMKLDLDYIDRWSLWLDLKIFMQTIPVVLLRRGAR